MIATTDAVLAAIASLTGTLDERAATLAATGMSSSAYLCLSDARTLLEKGEVEAAADNAVRASRYVWGILSPKHVEICKSLGR